MIRKIMAVYKFNNDSMLSLSKPISSSTPSAIPTLVWSCLLKWWLSLVEYLVVEGEAPASEEPGQGVVCPGKQSACSKLLYCTALYCTVLYCTVLYCTVLYCTVLNCTVLYWTTLYCPVLHCTALYGTVPYCIAMHCIALYYTTVHTGVPRDAVCLQQATALLL